MKIKFLKAIFYDSEARSTIILDDSDEYKEVIWFGKISKIPNEYNEMNFKLSDAKEGIAKLYNVNYIITIFTD